MSKFALPDMTFTFEIQSKGRETGVNWAGKFKYKRPTLGDRARIDVLRSRLSGDLETLRPDVLELIEAISHLRHTLTEYPEWWSGLSYGLDLYDGNVISDVYNKILEYEREWKEKVFGGSAGDVEVRDEFDSASQRAVVSQSGQQPSL